MYKTGLIITPQDMRDYRYSTRVLGTVGAASDKPRRIINDSKYILDQKNFGVCGGASGANAVEIYDRQPLSMLASYKFAKEVDEFGLSVEGTSMIAVAKGLKNKGVPLESLYPYERYTKLHEFPVMSEEAIEDAGKRKIDAFFRIYDVEELWDAIHRFSVIAGFILCENFLHPEFSSNGDSFIGMPEGYFIGGHAIHVPDIDLDLEHTYRNGKKYKGFAGIENSWGDNWGRKGKSWIPLEYFTQVSDIGMNFVPDIYALVKGLDIKKIESDVEPFISEGRTFMPLRFVSEALGEYVRWDGISKKAFIGDRIMVTVGSKNVIVDGNSIEIDVAPFIKEDRIFIPIRFIAECLNKKVEWLPYERRVEILSDKKVVDLWIGKKEIKVTYFKNL